MEWSFWICFYDNDTHQNQVNPRTSQSVHSSSLPQTHQPAIISLNCPSIEQSFTDNELCCQFEAIYQPSNEWEKSHFWRI